MRRSQFGLAAVDDHSAQEIAGIDRGVIVSVQIKQPRNPKRLRLYWAICNKISENSSYSKEQVDHLLKIVTGHVEPFTFNGMTGYLPRSISYNKMTESEFKHFLDQCIQYILTELLPGVSEDDFAREIEEIINGG